MFMYLAKCAIVLCGLYGMALPSVWLVGRWDTMVRLIKYNGNNKLLYIALWVASAIFGIANSAIMKILTCKLVDMCDTWVGITISILALVGCLSLMVRMFKLNKMRV